MTDTRSRLKGLTVLSAVIEEHDHNCQVCGAVHFSRREFVDVHPVWQTATLRSFLCHRAPQPWRGLEPNSTVRRREAFQHKLEQLGLREKAMALDAVPGAQAKDHPFGGSHATQYYFLRSVFACLADQLGKTPLIAGAKMIKDAIIAELKNPRHIRFYKGLVPELGTVLEYEQFVESLNKDESPGHLVCLYAFAEAFNLAVKVVSDLMPDNIMTVLPRRLMKLHNEGKLREHNLESVWIAAHYGYTFGSLQSVSVKELDADPEMIEMEQLLMRCAEAYDEDIDILRELIDAVQRHQAENAPGELRAISDVMNQVLPKEQRVMQMDMTQREQLINVLKYIRQFPTLGASVDTNRDLQTATSILDGRRDATEMHVRVLLLCASWASVFEYSARRFAEADGSHERALVFAHGAYLMRMYVRDWALRHRGVSLPLLSFFASVPSVPMPPGELAEAAEFVDRGFRHVVELMSSAEEEAAGHEARADGTGLQIDVGDGSGGEASGSQQQPQQQPEVLRPSNVLQCLQECLLVCATASAAILKEKEEAYGRHLALVHECIGVAHFFLAALERFPDVNAIGDELQRSKAELCRFAAKSVLDFCHHERALSATEAACFLDACALYCGCVNGGSMKKEQKELLHIMLKHYGVSESEWKRFLDKKDVAEHAEENMQKMWKFMVHIFGSLERRRVVFHGNEPDTEMRGSFYDFAAGVVKKKINNEGKYLGTLSEDKIWAVLELRGESPEHTAFFVDVAEGALEGGALSPSSTAKRALRSAQMILAELTWKLDSTVIDDEAKRASAVPKFEELQRHVENAFALSRENGNENVYNDAWALLAKASCAMISKVLPIDEALNCMDDCMWRAPAVMDSANRRLYQQLQSIVQSKITGGTAPKISSDDGAKKALIGKSTDSDMGRLDAYFATNDEEKQKKRRINILEEDVDEVMFDPSILAGEPLFLYYVHYQRTRLLLETQTQLERAGLADVAQLVTIAEETAEFVAHKRYLDPDDGFIGEALRSIVKLVEQDRNLGLGAAKWLIEVLANIVQAYALVDGEPNVSGADANHTFVVSKDLHHLLGLPDDDSAIIDPTFLTSLSEALDGLRIVSCQDNRYLHMVVFTHNALLCQRVLAHMSKQYKKLVVQDGSQGDGAANMLSFAQRGDYLGFHRHLAAHIVRETADDVLGKAAEDASPTDAAVTRFLQTLRGDRSFSLDVHLAASLPVRLRQNALCEASVFPPMQLEAQAGDGDVLPKLLQVFPHIAQNCHELGMHLADSGNHEKARQMLTEAVVLGCLFLQHRRSHEEVAEATEGQNSFWGNDGMHGILKIWNDLHKESAESLPPELRADFIGFVLRTLTKFTFPHEDVVREMAWIAYKITFVRSLIAMRATRMNSLFLKMDVVERFYRSADKFEAGKSKGTGKMFIRAEVCALIEDQLRLLQQEGITFGPLYDYLWHERMMKRERLSQSHYRRHEYAEAVKALTSVLDTRYFPLKLRMLHDTPEMLNSIVKSIIKLTEQNPLIQSDAEGPSIDTPAFHLLQREFAKYAFDLKNFRLDHLMTLAHDGEIDFTKSEHILERMEIKPAHRHCWIVAVQKYPFMPFVMRRMALMYHKDNRYQLANEMASHGVEVSTLLFGKASRFSVRQWEEAKHIFNSQRTEDSVRKGKLQAKEFESYATRLLASVAPADHRALKARDAARRPGPSKMDRITNRLLAVKDSCANRQSCAGKCAMFPLLCCWWMVLLFWWFIWVMNKVLVDTLVNIATGSWAMMRFIVSLCMCCRRRRRDVAANMIRDIKKARARGEMIALLRKVFFGTLAMAYFGACAGIVILAVFLPNTQFFRIISGQSWSGWYFFIPQALELLIMVWALWSVTWPQKPTLNKKFYERRNRELRETCFMIACHRSEDVIGDTLQSALGMLSEVEFFQPEQVYICHNGNQETPIDNTAKVAREISERYNYRHGRPNTPETCVNYSWVSIGNKTLAFYEVAKRLPSRFKSCVIIDDDVQVPEDIYIPTQLFRDSKVRALAFTIKAANAVNQNGRRNVIATMQSIEYMKSGLMKLVQSEHGSALFAHGAIACWDKDTMLRVLWEHNTEFHGEDLQMGVILQGFNEGLMIKAVAHVPVPTTVPDHSLCYQTIWCTHPLKSLLTQRVRSWDAAAHRFLFTYIRILFFHWSRASFSIKPFIVYELWTIFVDWLRIPLLLLLLLYSQLQTFILLGAVTGGQLILLLAFNYWTLRDRDDLRFPFLMILIYPLYGLLLVLYRYLGFLYALFVYIPNSRYSPRVRDLHAYAHPPADDELVCVRIQVHRNPKMPPMEVNARIHDPMIHVINMVAKKLNVPVECIALRDEKGNIMPTYLTIASAYRPPDMLSVIRVPNPQPLPAYDPITLALHDAVRSGHSLMNVAPALGMPGVAPGTASAALRNMPSAAASAMMRGMPVGAIKVTSPSGGTHELRTRRARATSYGGGELDGLAYVPASPESNMGRARMPSRARSGMGVESPTAESIARTMRTMEDMAEVLSIEDIQTRSVMSRRQSGRAGPSGAADGDDGGNARVVPAVIAPPEDRIDRLVRAIVRNPSNSLSSKDVVRLHANTYRILGKTVKVSEMWNTLMVEAENGKRMTFANFLREAGLMQS